MASLSGAFANVAQHGAGALPAGINRREMENRRCTQRPLAAARQYPAGMLVPVVWPRYQGNGASYGRVSFNHHFARLPGAGWWRGMPRKHNAQKATSRAHGRYTNAQMPCTLSMTQIQQDCKLFVIKALGCKWVVIFLPFFGHSVRQITQG